MSKPVDWKFASQYGDRMGMRTRVIRNPHGGEFILDCEPPADNPEQDTADLLISSEDVYGSNSVLYADISQENLLAIFAIFGIKPRAEDHDGQKD